MLPARAAPFRQLSRAGDEAVAVGDITQRLQRRIRPARQAGNAGRIRRRRSDRGDAGDLAGAASLAGNRAVAPTGRRHHPPAGCRAAAAVSRGHRHAGDQRFVLSRDRRGRRRPGGNRDVATSARALDAAFGMERGGRSYAMNCADTEIMLHALIDGELDAGHARDVEAHVASCPACAEELKTFRAMRATMVDANLREAAPAHLRSRIEASLALPRARVAVPRQSWLAALHTSWQNFFGGFAVGTALSAAVAASLVIAVIHNDQNQQIAGDIVSAHLRSLQAG